jgi:hypothetical protein
MRVYKNALQALEVLQPYFNESKGISCTSLRRSVLTRFAAKDFFSYESLNVRNQEKLIPTSYLRGIISYVPQPRIPFFWFTNSGSQATRLIWSIGSGIFYSTRKPCGKAVPETDYFTQQKQYLKRTTLRTWTSQSRERDAEWSAPTIARLIHSISVLLGT